MANHEPSGAGDGPAKLDSSCNVYDVLGPKMGTEGLRTMRLVCTHWLNNVEECVGVRVKVDDRVEGNLEFVRRVKVGNALVRNWTVDLGTEPASLLFQYPGWLKKLKLGGKMPVKWKIRHLCQFPSLAHLVLRDTALYLNNLTDPPYPVLNVDLTSLLSPDDQMKQAYQTQDPPSDTQPIELKNLQTLEIVRYYGDTFQNFSELPTHLCLVMAANICFILSHLASPLLSVVHLAVEQPFHFSHRYPRKKLNWTLEPLHAFLNYHRKTLRQVMLAPFKSSDLIDDESLSNSFPSNLRKLKLRIDGSELSRNSEDPPIQSTFTYFEKLLQAQTNLQDVKLDLFFFPMKWTTDALTSLANSCSHTLRYIELAGLNDKSTTSFDLQILSVFQSLQVLHLFQYCKSDQTILTFKNVDKLPLSLKRLVICCCSAFEKVEIGDLNFFKRLAVLEWLSLDNILPPAASNDGNQEPRWRFCRAMIESLLGLRKLQGFLLKILGLVLNTDQNLVSMLSPLNPDFKEASRFPGRANFNLVYPSNNSLDPWPDKPFDTSSCNMEKYRDE